MPLDQMADAGASTDSGGTSNPKPQLVCPSCGAKFEQVENDGADGGEDEDKSWEQGLKDLTARTPTNDGQAQ